MPATLKANKQLLEAPASVSCGFPVRRTVLVTGGIGGTGSAICKKMADLGHFVAVAYHNKEHARAWQDRMEQEGYLFFIYEEGSRDLVNNVIEDLGPIQILINNTDINSLGRVSHTTHKALEGMFETGFGRIINIYPAEAGSIREFTQRLVREVVTAKGITVNAISPGKPQDVAHVVSFLASEDSGFITGASIATNGVNII